MKATTTISSSQDWIDQDEKLKRLDAVQHVGSASQLLAMLEVEPDLAIKVTLGYKKLWVCRTDLIIKLLKEEKREATKFLKGEKNKWE